MPPTASPTPAAFTSRRLAVPAAPSLAEADAWCRELTRRHYENFTVASWLLPAALRQHFCRIYAYCRVADDLADEIADPVESLRQLDDWRRQLEACYAGEASHPVFVALRPTIAEFAIPREPFVDLLDAFRQDQRRTHYETCAELHDYCRRSANPVGRLVLYLGRSYDADNAELSDAICTGLQLANFWQDVARDYALGRIYLPRETYLRHGYDEAQFARGEYNDAFRAALADEVARAEQFFAAGAPLVERVAPSLRLPVDMFLQGGRAVLAAIRRLDYNVWRRRPTVGKLRKAAIVVEALSRRWSRRPPR